MMFPSIPGLFVYIQQALEDLSIVKGVAAGWHHQAKQVTLLGGLHRREADHHIDVDLRHWTMRLTLDLRYIRDIV